MGKRLPLWSSGQSSWQQIQRSGFDSRHYKIFWAVVGLERGSLSLMSTTEELLERKNSGSGLEIREYGRRDPLRWPRGTLYPKKSALTSPTSDGRSVGIVHLRTQATEFVVINGKTYLCYGTMLCYAMLCYAMLCEETTAPINDCERYAAISITVHSHPDNIHSVPLDSSTA
jgi:hypothetical protein